MISIFESLVATLIRAVMNAAPNSSKTIETVVDVGSPNELKRSSRKTSLTITARKITITSLNAKPEGLKIPLRATSIIPLLNAAPMKTPAAATNITCLSFAALAPTAEPIKFTASLLTPTHRSMIASTNRKTTTNR